MQNAEQCGKLDVDLKGAIKCPNCRRKIRGVRIPPGGVMKDISVKCHECRAEIIVNINQASATWMSPRH